jgi:hypothetical protein
MTADECLYDVNKKAERNCQLLRKEADVSIVPQKNFSVVLANASVNTPIP